MSALQLLYKNINIKIYLPPVVLIGMTYGVLFLIETMHAVISFLWYPEFPLEASSLNTFPATVDMAS